MRQTRGYQPNVLAFLSRISGFAGTRTLPEPIQRIDDDLYKRLAAMHSPPLDFLLPRLTRAANGGRLWMAFAAALALGGGRKGQRAALAGMAALATTSAIVNGPVKIFFRRKRPDPLLIPVLRRLHKAPITSSMPSGHSASAAAFAIAAGLQMPQAAAPLGVVAGAVGVSRVYTGAHHPSDVVVGGAIGATVAYSVHRILRRRDRVHGTEPPRPTKRVATRDGDGVVVAVNDSAGPMLAASPSRKLEDALPRARMVESPSEAAHAVTDAPAATRAVVVAGGDGTVNAVAAVAHDERVPLAVVPSGTMNHFARDVGIDSVDEAAAAIAGGEVADVPIAKAAGHTFLNTASFGVYSDVVDERERLESRLGKWPAATIAFARAINNSTPLEVEIDGRPMKVWSVFVGNGRYSPQRLMPVRRVSLDGVLDVRVLRADRRFPRVGALLARPLALVRTGVVERWTAQKLHVRSMSGTIRLACDGETFDAPQEFTIERCARPLEVLVPAEE